MSQGRVALIHGDERYANVMQALRAINEDIHLDGKTRVLIKPNFVSAGCPLGTTHRDAVRAVLDFLRERGAAHVTLAEGSAIGGIGRAIRNYGYQPLIDTYGLRVVDLNRDEAIEVSAWDSHLRPMKLAVARTVIESDFRISVGPPKTHDTVIVTLSLKNMAVGSLAGHKRRIHQGFPGINLNLYHMAYHVAPHLAVLDGYQGMEGNGPVSGRAVDWRIAIASADFLAADSLAASLMGFAPEQIGYLHYCQLKGLGQGDVARMEIVGNITPEQAQRSFKPHLTYKQQLKWPIEGVERYL